MSSICYSLIETRAVNLCFKRPHESTLGKCPLSVVPCERPKREHLRDLTECANERATATREERNGGLLVAAHLKNT